MAVLVGVPLVEELAEAEGQLPVLQHLEQGGPRQLLLFLLLPAIFALLLLNKVTEEMR